MNGEEQNQTQAQSKEIKYDKPHQMLLSLIKSINERSDKHYSYNASEKVFVPYNKDIKPRVHLTLKSFGYANYPTDKVEIGGLTFYKYIAKIESCVEDDCEEKQYEIALYRELVRNFRNEKQAWAVFYKYANQLSKTNPEYEYVVTVYRGKKSKHDSMELYAIPKSILEEFDKLIMEKISKYLTSQGYVEIPTATKEELDVFEVLKELWNNFTNKVNTLLNTNTDINKVIQDIVSITLNFMKDLREINEIVKEREKDKVVYTFRLEKFLEKIKQQT